MMSVNKKSICNAGLVCLGFVLCLMLTSCGNKPGKMGESEAVVVSSVEYPKLLELGSKTCIPCKTMAPIIDNLRKTYRDTLNVQFIDVYENKSVAEKYSVDIIPTQIFFDKSGKEFYRHTGIFSKEEILEQFKKQGIDPDKKSK